MSKYPCWECEWRGCCDGAGCKRWHRWVRDRWTGLQMGYRQLSWTQYIRQLVEEGRRK